MTESNSSARARKAQGPDRPAYFDHTDIDRVMGVILAMATELASLRDRLDTHERIAGSIAAVEAYEPDAAVLNARDQWRDSYIHRLFRVFTEDLEHLRQDAAKI